MLLLVRLFSVDTSHLPCLSVTDMAASSGTGSTATIVREGWLQKRGKDTQYTTRPWNRTYIDSSKYMYHLDGGSRLCCEQDHVHASVYVFIGSTLFVSPPPLERGWGGQSLNTQ